MDADRFDAVLRTLSVLPSRRAAVRLVTGFGLAGLLTRGDAAAKHKKKKKKPKKPCPECPICPSPPPPPPAAFCAGKNNCAQVANVTCQASGVECRCFIRQDNAAVFCGTVPLTTHPDCSSCVAGEVCVILGGDCVTGYACASACPSPR